MTREIAETVKITGRRDDPPGVLEEVDGKPFPWFISERGAVAKRVADDLFEVSIEIVGIAKLIEGDDFKAGDWLSLGLEGYAGRYLMIGGSEFPWAITEDGVTIRASRKLYPTVTLSFFAKSVDSTQDIEDARHVLDIDGALWADSRAGGAGVSAGSHEA